MAMGRGLMMYMLTQGESMEDQRRNEGGGREGGRSYNLGGTYNVTVGDGGNRSDYGGGVRTGDRRIGDPRSEYGGEGGRMESGGQGGRMESGGQGGRMESGGQGGRMESGGQGGRMESGGQGGRMESGGQGGRMESGGQGGRMESGGQGGRMESGGQGGRMEYGGQMGYGDSAEARYRGRDGRWRAGRRPNRMGMEEMRGGNRRRMGDDEDDDEEATYEVVVSPKDGILPMPWPYAPGMREERYSNYGREDATDRQIGFGAAMTMGGGEQHQQHMRMGRTGGMEQGQQLPELDEMTATRWVESLEGEDKNHPKGGKWSEEQLEPIAKKFGVPSKGPEWWEFYAVTNAMYADYSEVAKAYNITSPDYYAKLALAFIRDKDALPGKVQRYLRYVVGM